MRYLLILSALLFSFASTAKDVYVKGYTKKDGTYVQPHHRSAPNSNKADNWSTKGNTNPYTGKEGTQNVDDSDSSNNAATDTENDD